MHPLFSQPRRLALYLAGWIPVAGLLASLVHTAGPLDLYAALAFAGPLALVYAFVCLAAWFPCRSAPLRKTSTIRLVLTHGLSGLLSAAGWLVLANLWWWALTRLDGFSRLLAGADPAALFSRTAPNLFVVAVLLYLLAVTIAYLLLAFEESSEAESRNLALTVRARDAEIAAIDAQRKQELSERELTLARTMQQSLLPPPEIEGEGFRIAARNLPARFVAGDFYDVFLLPDGALGIVVADVAGKGVGASLIMASVKAMLPVLAERGSAAETVIEVNRRLAAERGGAEFVALSFARFEPKTGSLALVNAGLPDPYLLCGDRPPRPLSAPGPRLPLGRLRDLAYQPLELELATGERVVWLTDGLPEAPTAEGEPLGYEALEALLPRRADSASACLDVLFDRLKAAVQPGLEDDWTALVLERTWQG